MKLIREANELALRAAKARVQLETEAAELLTKYNTKLGLAESMNKAQAEHSIHKAVAAKMAGECTERELADVIKAASEVLGIHYADEVFKYTIRVHQEARAAKAAKAKK